MRRPPAGASGLSDSLDGSRPYATGVGTWAVSTTKLGRRSAQGRRRVDAVDGRGPLDEPGRERVGGAHHLRERTGPDRHPRASRSRGPPSGSTEGRCAPGRRPCARLEELLATRAVQLFRERAPLGGLSGQDRKRGCHHWHGEPPRARACPATDGRTRHWPCATVLATVWGRRAGESPRLPASVRWMECTRRGVNR